MNCDSGGPVYCSNDVCERHHGDWTHCWKAWEGWGIAKVAYPKKKNQDQCMKKSQRNQRRHIPNSDCLVIFVNNWRNSRWSASFSLRPVERASLWIHTSHRKHDQIDWQGNIYGFLKPHPLNIRWNWGRQWQAVDSDMNKESWNVIFCFNRTLTMEQFEESSRIRVTIMQVKLYPWWT
jgi:hypothetical protein